MSTSTTRNTAMSPPRHLQPLRAITSTLSARAPPSVPPASQTYEPLARAVLRRRLLYHILPQSSLAVWALTTFWMTSYAGGISTLSLSKLLVIPILPTTLLLTFLVWAFGVLPIIVFRKSHLTGEHATFTFLVLTSPASHCAAVSVPSSSPSQRVKVTYSDPNSLRALSVYIIAGIFISTFNVTVYRTFETTSRGSDLWVFAKSRYSFPTLRSYFSDSHLLLQISSDGTPTI